MSTFLREVNSNWKIWRNLSKVIELVSGGIGSPGAFYTEQCHPSFSFSRFLSILVNSLTFTNRTFTEYYKCTYNFIEDLKCSFSSLCLCFCVCVYWGEDEGEGNGKV